jgi:hypothetical protein
MRRRLMVRDDRTTLLFAIGDAINAGDTIPCQEQPFYFTSESSDHQHVAARWCGDCPVLKVCRKYGKEHPREYGVYGGLTDHQRSGVKDSNR